MEREGSRAGVVATFRRWAVVASSAAVCACATGGGSANQGGEEAARRDPDSAAPPRTLEGSAPGVLAVQLLSNQPTQTVPVIRRESRDRLLLVFDMAGSRGEFYTIQFFPANLEWAISTAPEEGILPPPDDITDYEQSGDLDFPYVQYRYEFPNSRVDFYRSGNFVLRVANDAGQPLIERRFYVSDDEVEFDILAKSTSLITDRPDELVPEARVPIPTDPWFSPDDCSVTFLKNGWTDETQHVGIARAEGNRYVYEARSDFRNTIPVYFTDLRGVSGIRRRDEITVPITVSLLPDDMRFWGDDYRYSSPLPRPVGVPDTQTRYVRTIFTVQGGPRGQSPYLVGTFNDWLRDPSYRLEWNADGGTYELEVPLREGEFFYTYSWEDPNAVRPQSKFEGPRGVVFTAIVYAKDTRYPTERILALKSQRLPEE